MEAVNGNHLIVIILIVGSVALIAGDHPVWGGVFLVCAFLGWAGTSGSAKK